MSKPVLIVTVTKIEAQSVLKTFASPNGAAWKSSPIGNKTYYELGIHGNVPIFMVQSEMGTATPGGATLTVRGAIQHIQPQAVIMCGIAFGLQSDKQKLGEILIARQIQCYEIQKIDMQKGPIARGDRAMASERLLDRFRRADNDWVGVKTYFGLIMSGEKLVNDPGFRDLLLQSEPESIGGEMEGAGLYAAARDAKVDWIMVKAICDWGDGTKNSNAQKLAAQNAAQFVLHTLQQGGLSVSEQSELSESSGEVKNNIIVNGNVEGNIIIGNENTALTSNESIQIKSESEVGNQSSQRGNATFISEDNPEILKWLTKVGLIENPFRHQDAEQNDPYLSKYFSRFPELETVTAHDLTSERKTWIFWGREGSGKTALRKFLAARGRPHKAEADVFCAEIDPVKFEHLLFSINDISEFQVNFIRSIYETCLQNFPIQSVNAIISWHSQSDLQENLSNLSMSLRQYGINWVLCLIDPGKEFFTWKGSHIKTSSLLAPALSFPDVGGVGFRYFLPNSVKDELQKTFSTLPRSQRRLMQIEWNEDALKKLIGKRMITLSLDQAAPYRSLGELCDDDKNLSSLIDSEIATLAQGNPRGAIWLANRLIEMHCQNPMPASRISPQTWDDVKLVWWSSGESRILNIPQSNKFRVLGERIFFRNHEIILSGRSNQLLSCLAQAKDGFRTKEELILASWPGENQSGVSEKALSEAIRRMKEELKNEMEMKKELKSELNIKEFEGFDWIKSVRNRGYRLVYPDVATKAEEEEYD